MTEYYRCKECWRVYDEFQLIHNSYNGCECGSRRFKGNRKITLEFLRRLFTDYKYVFLGEKAYEKRS